MSNKRIKMDNQINLVKRNNLTFYCNIENEYEMKMREEMLSSGENADIDFLVGKKNGVKLFFAHRFILMTASKTFRDLMDANKEKKVIELPDVSPEEFETLLR